MRGETDTHLAIKTGRDNQFIIRDQLFSAHVLGFIVRAGICLVFKKKVASGI